MRKGRRMVSWGAVTLGLWMALAPLAAESASDLCADLKDALSQAQTYKFGDSRAVLVQIDRLVAEASARSKTSHEAESLLLDCLTSDGTTDCKRFLCRKIRLVGSEDAVPVLADLLGDPKLSHMARYAMENISGKAATEALLKAMDQLEGKLLLGIIGSLGARKDAMAGDALAERLSSDEEAVVKAAAAALGRIGGSKAIDALSEARKGVSDSLRLSLTAALIQCADNALEKGKRKQANELFELIYKENKDAAFQGAALLGMGKSDPKSAPSLVLKGLKSKDPSVRNAAIALVREAPGNDLAKQLAESFNKAPASEKCRLLNALLERQNLFARPAALAAIEDGDPALKIEGIKSLSFFGEASDVPSLIDRIVTGEEAEKNAARAALHRMRDENADKALMDTMSDASAREKWVIVNALSERHAQEAVPLLFDAAKSKDADLRLAALQGLQVLSRGEDLGDMINLLASIKADKEREEAEKALTILCKGLETPDTGVERIVEELSGTREASVQSSFLKVVGDVGGERALSVLKENLRSTESLVREAALRALMNWPNASPAEDLLELARETKDDTHRALALRGSIRLASQLAPKDPLKGADLLLQSHKLAKGTDEIKLVLSGLRSARDLKSFRLAANYLSEGSLRSEAELAVVNIAPHIAAANASETSKVLKEILDSTKNEDVKKKAQETLKELEKRKGLLTSWQLAGPFSLGNKKGPDLFNVAFPAEKNESKGVSWKPVARGIHEDRIDLIEALGEKKHSMAYLRTLIESPKDQKVRLDLGSDDGIKLWVNGRLMHANNASRGHTPGEDKVVVNLKKGSNSLFLKVTQGEGGWAFSVRVLDVNGNAVEGLKTAADIPDGLQFVLGGADSTPLEYVGDYEGTWKLSDGQQGRLVAQVIGQSGGGYRVNLKEAFDNREKSIATLTGFISDQGVSLSGLAESGPLAGTQWEAALSHQTMKGAFEGEKKGAFSLRKETRLSPTMGVKPPEGAIVLFDGKNTDAWVHGNGKPCRWRVTEDGAMEVLPGTGAILSKRQFQDQQIHVEFRTPYMPDKTGQARGNSGVYVMNKYEVQILDSYGLYGHDNECGGIYKVAEPLINMCAPPMQWQTYDITFTAPRLDSEGKQANPARITVLHNGVKIHDDVEISGGTGSSDPKKTTDRGALHLQDHGNKVQFRNIWIAELSSSP